MKSSVFQVGHEANSHWTTFLWSPYQDQEPNYLPGHWSIHIQNFPSNRHLYRLVKTYQDVHLHLKIAITKRKRKTKESFPLLEGKCGNSKAKSNGTVHTGGLECFRKRGYTFWAEVLPFSSFYRNNQNLTNHLFRLPVLGFLSRESEKFRSIL